MHHTWISLFFWIVLCCPVAVVAEDENRGAAEQNKASTFRDCVLEKKEWKTECSQMLPFSTNNPYSVGALPQERVFSDKLVPERGGVWGLTPAETFRKLYFPDRQREG